MPYTINRYNGQVIATVADGTIDSTTDLKLIGKNYAGYGEVQNENFLYLLENFANTTQPPKPLGGQLWYDSGNSKLKFYDGSKFRTTGGAEVGIAAPTGLTIGDFWWDTNNKQLYTWDGATYILVGPQGVAGSQTTQMRSRSVRDTLGASHAIIEAIVDGDTKFIISADSTFTLDSNTNLITGFSIIQKGITLAYTTSGGANEGVTTSDDRFWGTATNSDRLGGYEASNFVQKGSALFDTVVDFSNAGFRVGDAKILKVFIGPQSKPVILNDEGDTIKFQTTAIDGVTKNTPLQLVGNNMLPATDNATDIGSGSLRFKTINAVTFSGTATKADSLYVGQDDYRTASSAASNGTVAIRTGATDPASGGYPGGVAGQGSLRATYFIGTATAANYADLAEMYLADAEYDVGTVLVIGGEKEVTASKWGKRALGAVSASPAYLMNKDLEGGTIVALKGRIPVKVVGRVKKGEELIASDNGCATVAIPHSSGVFAIALESSDDSGIKLVECVIL